MSSKSIDAQKLFSKTLANLFNLYLCRQTSNHVMCIADGSAYSVVIDEDDQRTPTRTTSPGITSLFGIS